MLTVGDKFPQFKLKATVSNDLNNAFVDIDNNTYKGKWLVRVLLSEGLHLRLPDRDHRLRQAQPGSSRTATRSC